MDLELEAKQWMKERQLSSITATEYRLAHVRQQSSRRNRLWNILLLV